MKYIDYYKHLLIEDLRSEKDEYYYHITLAPYLETILVKGLQIGKKATVSNYSEHSRGKIFLCDIGVVDWWKYNIEQHAFHQFDDEKLMIRFYLLIFRILFLIRCRFLFCIL
jgi:hypothetical protein